MNYTEEGRIRFVKRGATNWRGYRFWEIWINQGWRVASVIECIESCFLFLYWMPNGNHFYAEVGLNNQGEFSNAHKPINKLKPPGKWRYEVNQMEKELN